MVRTQIAQHGKLIRRWLAAGRTQPPGSGVNRQYHPSAPARRPENLLPQRWTSWSGSWRTSRWPNSGVSAPGPCPIVHQLWNPELRHGGTDVQADLLMGPGWPIQPWQSRLQRTQERGGRTHPTWHPGPHDRGIQPSGTSRATPGYSGHTDGVRADRPSGRIRELPFHRVFGLLTGRRGGMD